MTRRRPVDAPAPGVQVLGTLAFVGPLLLLGKSHLPFMQGPLVLVPMLGALAAAAVMAWLAGLWARARDFGDRHLLALASGAVVAHTLCGDLAFSRSLGDAVARVCLGAAMVVLLVLLAIRVRRTATRTAPMPRSSAPL